VAVSAPHLAFLYLLLNRFPRDSRQYQISDCSILALDVVEFENTYICFATVHARMMTQVFLNVRAVMPHSLFFFSSRFLNVGLAVSEIKISLVNLLASAAMGVSLVSQFAAKAKFTNRFMLFADDALASVHENEKSGRRESDPRH
jgi:hypothetical protein